MWNKRPIEWETLKYKDAYERLDNEVNYFCEYVQKFLNAAKDIKQFHPEILEVSQKALRHINEKREEIRQQIDQGKEGD